MARKRTKYRVAMIAAVDTNGAIGKDGVLPWHCKADLKYFQNMTLGRVLLMGRKTADGLPKALRNRVNLVLTRDPTWHREGFIPVYTKRGVYKYLRQAKQDTLWVIGGEGIYRAYINQADVIHLTVLDIQVGDPDAWFPMDGLAQYRGLYVQPSTDPCVMHHVYHRDRITSTRGVRLRGVVLI